MSQAAYPRERRATFKTLLFSLAPDGVCLASHVTAAAGGLLHHRFTLARKDALEHLPLAVCFLLRLFLGVTPTGRYPASCPMEFGLSSSARANATIRSTLTQLEIYQKNNDKSSV